MDRDFAASGPHGDADITRCQGRCIIHSITDNGNLVTLSLDTAHEVDLVLRQAFSFNFLTTDLSCHTRRYRLAIAGDHSDAANPAHFELGKRFAGFGPRLIL